MATHGPRLLDAEPPVLEPLRGRARAQVLGPKFVDYLGIVGPPARDPRTRGPRRHVLPQVAADELGLRRSTLVVKGAMDQAESALGAGNICPGHRHRDHRLGHGHRRHERTGSIPAGPCACPYQPHVLPGSILYLPYVQTAGSAYKWWRDRFCQEEVRQAGDLEAAYDLMNALGRRRAAGIGRGRLPALPRRRRARPRTTRTPAACSTA